MAFDKFKLDVRNLFIIKKLDGSEVLVRRANLDNFYYSFLLPKTVNIFYTNTVNSSNIFHHILLKTYSDLFGVLLRNSYINIYFFNDVGASLILDKQSISYNFSCFHSNDRVLLSLYSNTNAVSSSPSIANIYFGAQWAERELQELNSHIFTNMPDSRRLMTDYLTDSQLNYADYKLDSYDLVIQDLYKWMLHWYFFFLFLIFIVISSFFFINFSLFHTILISEVLIIFLVSILGINALCFNVYYLIGLGVLLLIFGGLELSLNLIFLVI